MWLSETKDIFLLRSLPFQDALLSDRAAYTKEVFAVAESSFHHVDISETSSKGMEVMYVYPFLSNQDFVIEGSNYEVKFGDCLISLQRVEGMPEAGLIRFYYTKNKKPVGSGSKKFKVDCEVKDIYTLEIFANTKEEAIEIAKNIPPSKWDHIVVDSHLEEIAMVRMARWGNMSSKEIA
jgi:hypothetical protein